MHPDIMPVLDRFQHGVLETIERRLMGQGRLGTMRYATVINDRQYICAIGAVLPLPTLKLVLEDDKTMETGVFGGVDNIRRLIRHQLASGKSFADLRKHYGDVLVAFLHDSWVCEGPDGSVLQVTGPFREGLAVVWDQYLSQMQKTHDCLAARALDLETHDRRPERWVSMFSELVRIGVLPLTTMQFRNQVLIYQNDTNSTVFQGTTN